MNYRTMNHALDVSREISALPDVKILYTVASSKLGPQYNDDKIELDISQARSDSKSFIREVCRPGWTIEENGDYWTLHSDYYPNSTEEMLEVRHPEA